VSDLDSEIAELKQQRDYAAEQAHGLRERWTALKHDVSRQMEIANDAARQVEDLENENAELHKDRERLNWLIRQWPIDLTRESIDEALKDEQIEAGRKGMEKYSGALEELAKEE